MGGHVTRRSSRSSRAASFASLPLSHSTQTDVSAKIIWGYACAHVFGAPDWVCPLAYRGGLPPRDYAQRTAGEPEPSSGEELLPKRDSQPRNKSLRQARVPRSPADPHEAQDLYASCV